MNDFKCLTILYVSVYLCITEADTSNITDNGQKSTTNDVMNSLIREVSVTKAAELVQDSDNSKIEGDKQILKNFIKPARNSTKVKPRFLGSLLPMVVPVIGKLASWFFSPSSGDSPTTPDPDFEIPTTKVNNVPQRVPYQTPLQNNIGAQTNPNIPIHINNPYSNNNQPSAPMNNNQPQAYNVQSGNGQNIQPQQNENVIIIHHKPNIYFSPQQQQLPKQNTYQDTSNNIYVPNYNNQNTIPNHQYDVPLINQNNNLVEDEYYTDGRG